MFIGCVLLSACGTGEQESASAGVTENTATQQVPENEPHPFVGTWQFDIDAHMALWQQTHNIIATPHELEKANNMYGDAKLTLNANNTYDLWMPIKDLNGPGTWTLAEDGTRLLLTKANQPTMELFINGYSDTTLLLLPDRNKFWPSDLETLEFRR